MKPATAVPHAGNISEADVRQSLAARANRYDVVSRLADDLAHEIKNPLNAIVVNLEVLRRKMETGATDVALERARVIDGEIARVNGLLDQLLQLVRPEKSGSGVVALDEVLAALAPLLELQARAARAHFQLANTSDVFTRVPADVVKFAVLNLVTAMYEAGPKMEQIRLELGTSGREAAIRVAGVPPLPDDENEYVQAARVLLETAGGSLMFEGDAHILKVPTSTELL